jgi:hypothetical protein
MHNGPGNSEAESQVILESTHPNSGKQITPYCMRFSSEKFRGNTSLDEDSVAPSLSEEILVSNIFKFVLNVQLVLILFHTLLWLVG